MDTRTKVFFIEPSCAKLVSLMLWLDQYPEFELVGTASSAFDLRDVVSDAEPDVVLFDIGASSPDDLRSIRELKTTRPCPAVLVMHQDDVALMEGPLTRETDGQIGPKTSLKELAEHLRRAANKRRVALSVANVPATRAG